MSLANLLATRPSLATIQAACATASRTTGIIPTGMFGISQPQAFTLKTLEKWVIDLIAEAGFNSVRFEIKMSQLYPTQGATPDWGPYDESIDYIHSKGMNVAAIVTYLPDWVGDDWAVIDTHCQTMFQQIVTHLNTKGIRILEFFNEPNLTGFGWLGKPTDPGWAGVMSQDFLGAYFLLFGRFSAIVRSINPQMVVLNGGLANHDVHTWFATSLLYFQVMYAVNGQNTTDVLAFHPYGLQGQFAQARGLMDTYLNAAGMAGRPVWANEYGWAAWQSMDIRRYPTDARNSLLSILNGIRHFDGYYHFCVKDYSLNPGTPTFGLCDYYGVKRPGYALIRNIRTLP